VTAEDETYLEELREDFETLDAHRKRLEREALVARVDVATGRPLTVEKGHTPKDIDDDPFGEPRSIPTPSQFANPWNLDEMRVWNRPKMEIGAELRARALSAIEKMSGTNDQRRKAMTEIIETRDTTDGQLANQALITSHPDYLRAFNKMARNPNAPNLNVAEQQAVERTMSLTDSAGGYLVPFQLDPAVIITSDGSLNQIRQVARQVTATGDVWNGVSAGATSWSWDAENAEVSDDTSTFAQPSITIYTGRGRSRRCRTSRTWPRKWDVCLPSGRTPSRRTPLPPAPAPSPRGSSPPSLARQAW
jgi:hypothetical protein